MTEASAVNLDRLAAQAAAILSARLGQAVQLAEPTLLKDATRTLVLRARAQGAGPAHDSVIIKALRDDAATGFAEWAALAFLAELPAAKGLVPGFLGGDAGQGLIVLEDLGLGATLHELLMGGTRAEAEAALRELAQQMARLHLATRGHEARFSAIRQGLPAAEGHGRQREAAAWLASRARMLAWLSATGCAAPAGLDAGLELIAAAYAEPGPWLSFSHGDPAPSNNHIAGQRVRLLDFEYGAYRHLCYDISAWNILCPLPLPAVALMREAFEGQLAGPLGVEHNAFSRPWAMLCAYRALAMITWVTPAILEADRPFVGDWTARQAILAALTRAAAACAPLAELAPITSALERLRDALRERWPAYAQPALATRWPALS
jgi:hypothetical protein